MKCLDHRCCDRALGCSHTAGIKAERLTCCMMMQLGVAYAALSQTKYKMDMATSCFAAVLLHCLKFTAYLTRHNFCLLFQRTVLSSQLCSVILSTVSRRVVYHSCRASRLPFVILRISFQVRPRWHVPIIAQLPKQEGVIIIVFTCLHLIHFFLDHGIGERTIPCNRMSLHNGSCAVMTQVRRNLLKTALMSLVSCHIGQACCTMWHGN